MTETRRNSYSAESLWYILCNESDLLHCGNNVLKHPIIVISKQTYKVSDSYNAQCKNNLGGGARGEAS
jgi:hypothetical protein